MFGAVNTAEYCPRTAMERFGKTHIAVARGFNIIGTPTTWFIRYSSGIPDESIDFGAGFGFAQGDYDGDGKTALGYFMSQDAANVGFWYLASSANREARFYRFGQRPTVPLAAEIPIAGYNNR